MAGLETLRASRLLTKTLNHQRLNVIACQVSICAIGEPAASDPPHRHNRPVVSQKRPGRNCSSQALPCIQRLYRLVATSGAPMHREGTGTKHRTGPVALENHQNPYPL